MCQPFKLLKVAKVWILEQLHLVHRLYTIFGVFLSTSFETNVCPFGYISFSGKYEILESYKNCESGKEITTEEDCRNTAQDFGLPPGDSWTDPRNGQKYFSYKSAFGLPYCLVFPWGETPWKTHPSKPPLRVHFNLAKVTSPYSYGWNYYRAICLKGKGTPTNSSGKSSDELASLEETIVL